MSMIYSVTVNGGIPENAYFYIDEETLHGFLVDPGASGAALFNMASEKGWEIEGLLITHGHFDHVGGVAAFAKAWEQAHGAPLPVYIGEAGEKYLKDPEYNLSLGFGGPVLMEGKICYQKDGAVVKLEDGSLSLQYISTPGHTEDSGIWYDEASGIAFVGDTIFADGGYGNFRFPGGSFEVLMDSIQSRILTLPEDTRLLSGHSGPTTVGRERKFYTKSL